MADAGINLTLIIIALTGLLSWRAFSDRVLFENLMFYPYRMARRNDYKGFITVGFVHSGWMHLLLNMFVLYQFGGNVVEPAYSAIFGTGIGSGLYLALYFSALVVSGIPDYMSQKDNPSYMAVGASGATSAIIFAYIFFAPWSTIYVYFLPLPAIVWGVIYLLYSSYMARQGGDGIGHNAHFWGAAWGFVCTVAISAVLRPEMISVFIAQLSSLGQH